MKKFTSLLLITFSIYLNSLKAQSTIEDAEQSFNYISSTLYTFQTTGRLVNNPGVDGADLEAFIDLLRLYYDEFSREFNRNSMMCQFYRDPDNGRMTIEQRAEISFSFSPAKSTFPIQSGRSKSLLKSIFETKFS